MCKYLKLSVVKYTTDKQGNNNPNFGKTMFYGKNNTVIIMLQNKVKSDITNGFQGTSKLEDERIAVGFKDFEAAQGWIFNKFGLYVKDRKGEFVATKDFTVENDCIEFFNELPVSHPQYRDAVNWLPIEEFAKRGLTGLGKINFIYTFVPDEERDFSGFQQCTTEDGEPIVAKIKDWTKRRVLEGEKSNDESYIYRTWIINDKEDEHKILSPKSMEYARNFVVEIQEESNNGGKDDDKIHTPKNTDAYIHNPELTA